MKAVTKKIDKIFKSVLLLPSYVEYYKSKFETGKAIFDPENMMVLRTVSRDYHLITNQEIYDFLNSLQDAKIVDGAVSRDHGTYYLYGYFPDIYVQDEFGNTLFVSWEIGNSYTSRFIPYINLGLYHYLDKIHLRTNIPGIKISSRNEDWRSSIDGFSFDSLSRIKSIPSYNKMLFNYNFITEGLPDRYRLYSQEIIRKYEDKYRLTAYGALMYYADIVTNRWQVYSYERATQSQIKIFEKIIKEGVLCNS
jgi:hypothetical protein